MIQSLELAATLSDRLVAIFAELEDTIRLVESEEPAELQTYRQAIGCVCGALVLDVMSPLYKSHPTVKPASWASVEL